MKANELRIGNSVHFSGEVIRVELIDTCEVWFGERQEADLDECSGIPLTEEWLLKFGFEKNDNKSFSDAFLFIMVGGSKLHINPDNGVVWIVRDGNIFNNPQLIRFVHQLQNLYFALTGEELEIK